MLPWRFLSVNQFDSVSGSLDSINATGRVLGSLSRPIFMITARGTPRTIPIIPKPNPRTQLGEGVLLETYLIFDPLVVVRLFLPKSVG